jgi:hypothetical protein
VLSLAAWIGVPAVRADHIDDSLINASRDLARTLHEKGFKNIGVLKFLVKKGNARPDGNAGALNLNIAERIEWALIHGMEESKPLAVIQNATHTAARGVPHFSVRSVQARKALFSHKYPLHWVSERVAPDVFLTGTVDLSTDMRSATVNIGYFDKSGTIHELKKLKVKTDPSILADSGQSFAISKRKLRKARDLSELDDDSADSASKADQGTSVDKQLSNDNDSAPIKFDILFNGMAQQKTADSNSPGEFRIDQSPQAGTTVTFQMTNTTQDKIAVVVKVNGLNTIGKEDNEDQACTKWILEPGKLYGLRGYYVDDKVYVFQVLSDDESAARVSDEAFKGRGGWIDVTVFPQGSGRDDTAKISRSLRGLTKHGSKTKPKNLAEARALVNKHIPTATAGRKSYSRRGLIVEGNAQDQKLETDDFQISPTPSYHMQINYYSAPATGTDGGSK